MRKYLLILPFFFLLTGCRWFTYTLKDVQVIDKTVKLYRSGEYPDYYIIIQKGERKAKIEVDSEDYYRIEKGQHMDIWVKEKSSYLKEYKVNMEAE